MVTKQELEDLLDGHHERMRPNGNGAALKWLLGLLSVAVIAVVAVLWNDGNRITVLETILPRIEKKLDAALVKP